MQHARTLQLDRVTPGGEVRRYEPLLPLMLRGPQLVEWARASSASSRERCGVIGVYGLLNEHFLDKEIHSYI